MPNCNAHPHVNANMNVNSNANMNVNSNANMNVNSNANMNVNVDNKNNNYSKFNKVPSNVYDDCPALMSDGRFITSYLPNCEMNNNVSKLFSNKPLTSWEYTYYLTNEAGKANSYFLNKYQKEYGCKAYPYKIIDPKLKQDCTIDNCVINDINLPGMAMY